MKRIPRKDDPFPPLVVMGLGNPGDRYKATRHNVGYRVTDILLEQCTLQFRRKRFTPLQYACIPGDRQTPPIYLVRWLGYMNNSGVAISKIQRILHFVVENFYVVVDNMDIPPGACRLKKGGGHAGHNGLKSLISALGNGDFNRLYIGVGRPSPGKEVVEYVLGRPNVADEEAIDVACNRAALGLLALRDENFDRVAEKLNRRET